VSAGKIYLRDNEKLSDSEYATAVSLCDIIAKVIETAKAELPGGIFWGEVDNSPTHSLYRRKTRREIDRSALLPTRFRDFPTIIYEHDNLTPKPDFWVRRYIRLS
jgi:hypothetical protein